MQATQRGSIRKQLKESESVQSTEKVLKASKSTSRGIELELHRSKNIHEAGIPILVSPIFLRNLGCGQIDIAIYRNSKILLYEVKSNKNMLTKRQINRLKQSGVVLSEVLGCETQLRFIN